MEIEKQEPLATGDRKEIDNKSLVTVNLSGDMLLLNPVKPSLAEEIKILIRKLWD